MVCSEKVKESTLKKLEETATSGAKLEAEASAYEKKVEGLTKDVRELQLKVRLFMLALHQLLLFVFLGISCR